MPRTLSTAEERAVAVIDAAVHVFAINGYHATPVNDVAAAAGISPAYVFRLFPTKRELFLAAVHECFERILNALRDGADAADPLAAMAQRYAGLIADRDLMMLQVHALAATGDDAIRTALRTEQRRLVDFVVEHTDADQPAVQDFFARGQLCHLATALNLFGDRSRWAHQLTDGMTHATARARR